jgi:glycosyltransferase involved in cell wall biosynthesis
MIDPVLKLVSVIIPAYNAEATILQTLRSAQEQTYPALEIIVVDDGSSDETPAIVGNIAHRDPRISLIRQSNAGVAVARNRALAAAKGQYIAPLDADDLWHPEKVSRQVQCFDRNAPSTGVVYCWSADVDEQGLIIKYRRNLERSEGDVYAALTLANFIGNSSVPLIRRHLFEEIGGWEPGLLARDAQGCEDWLLYLKLAERTNFALTPAFLVGYRQIVRGMSRNIPQMRRSFALVMREAREAHPELPGALFRWSQSEFDFYIAELYWGLADRRRAIWFAFCAFVLDPSWLIRRSTIKMAWGGIRRLNIRAMSAVHRVDPPDTEKPPYPIGYAFHAICPEPDYEVDDGPVIAARRRYVASTRISPVRR